jgi:hypothetical protein
VEDAVEKLGAVLVLPHLSALTAMEAVEARGVVTPGESGRITTGKVGVQVEETDLLGHLGLEGLESW